MYFKSLASLLLSATLLQSSLATTCWGSTGVDPNNSKQSAWDLRDAVCGHGACAASDSEQGSNSYCVVSQPFADTGMVTLQRHDSTGAFPNCYAAFENIIQQCFSDSTASFDASSDPNGSWSVGDEWYWITMNYTMPTAASEGDGVEVNGIPTGGTLMGPASFCQGLSPGGGDSCMDIPAGCYIDVPLYNTVPPVECDLPLDG